jgi:hypothetical protein
MSYIKRREKIRLRLMTLMAYKVHTYWASLTFVMSVYQMRYK